MRDVPFTRAAALGSILLAASTLAACGSGLRQAATFRGDAGPPRVSPAHVRETASLPSAHRRLGEVSAECTLTEGRIAIDDEWLSDVDCSEARLLRALREEAAERGGDVLFERSCYSRVLSADDATARRFSRCEAQVARGQGRPARPEAVIVGSETASAAEAWRIRVTFFPANDLRRRPRRADLVSDVAHWPVSDVVLGDITASCERGCSRQAVRDGVRAAAGRIGANHVVDVSCVDRQPGYTCSGTAAVYERDPETTPAAR
jgi:hypothetical protein